MELYYYTIEQPSRNIRYHAMLQKQYNQVLYLVGGWPTPLKMMEFVSWDDYYIPY